MSLAVLALLLLVVTMGALMSTSRRAVIRDSSGLSESMSPSTPVLRRQWWSLVETRPG